MIKRSPWRASEEIIRIQILEKIERKQYQEADKITREFIERIYKDEIAQLSLDQIKQLIDKITGGLGYFKNDWNIMRMNYVGSIISWAEVVKDRAKILEIGTGIGRTCFTVMYSRNVSEYITIDNSPEILAIALFKNPIDFYQKTLWDKRVRVILGDALKVITRINDKFDHIIHDGGPTPSKNPRLYSRSFLKKLVLKLKRGGTLSVFGGRDPLWVDRVYKNLALLGLKVETVSFPDAPVRVFHCVKIH